MKTRNLIDVVRQTRLIMVICLTLLLLLGLNTTALARGGDSPEELFDDGREALDDDEFRAAARLFGELYDEFPESEHTGDALYWRAYAYYRLGHVKYLKKALNALSIQIDEYPEASTLGDAEDLLVRIEGKLAKAGDAAAAGRVAERADDAGQELKIATLHALMNMNSKKAVPILRKILSDRDSNSAELREQALFILVNEGDPEESAELLLDVARNDPDEDVRAGAVFWLSQVPGEESIIILEEILRDSDDEELCEQAVFSLSQHDNRRSRLILRELVTDDDRSGDVREQAVFWLANEGDDDDIAYLMEIYPDLGDEDMREQILFGVAESGGAEGRRWLMEIVRDEDEDDETRATALFWVGQGGGLSTVDLMGIYRGTENREMREQVLFVLSQSGDEAALEQIIDIARFEKDPELRENAIFWISQFDDEAAEDFLIDLINE